MPPRTDFSKLLRVLLDGAVEFILVGGVAGSLHGAARATYDVDVVLQALAGEHVSPRHGPRAL